MGRTMVESSSNQYVPMKKHKMMENVLSGYMSHVSCKWTRLSPHLEVLPPNSTETTGNLTDIPGKLVGWGKTEPFICKTTHTLNAMGMEDKGTKLPQPTHTRKLYDALWGWDGLATSTGMSSHDTMEDSTGSILEMHQIPLVSKTADCRTH